MKRTEYGDSLHFTYSLSLGDEITQSQGLLDWTCHGTFCPLLYRFLVYFFIIFEILKPRNMQI
jgi:hypothetical protein